jgi:hypothetical protein
MRGREWKIEEAQTKGTNQRLVHIGFLRRGVG